MDVVQLNCAKCRDVMCELGVYMCENGVSVALVQEPYVLMGGVKGFPASFRVVTSTVTSDHIGISGIVINDVGLDVFVVQEHTSELGACAIISGSLGAVCFVSVYCRFGENIEPYLVYMEAIRLMCRDKGMRLVIGMDANAVSPLWYSKGLDRARGRLSEVNARAIEDWVLEGNLEVVNAPSEWYTFSGPRGQSDINVTLTNAGGGDYSFKWEVQPQWGTSDHNLISIRVDRTGDIQLEQGSSDDAPMATIRWNTIGVDWKEYGEDIKVVASSYSLEEYRALSLSDKVRVLNDWISTVNDRNLRRITRSNAKKVKWWNRDLCRKRQEVRDLRRRLQSGLRRFDEGDPRIVELRRVFRTGVKTYREMIVLAKTKDWRGFVKTEGNADPWGPVSKVCRAKRRPAEVPSIRREDGTYTADWRESVTALSNVFFPEEYRTSVRQASVVYDRSPLIPDPVEISGAVMHCRVRAAPGWDGFTGKILRGVWGAIPEYLVALYEQCFTDERFPREWKMANLVILLKSPDKVRHLPGSYRPICLLPIMGKVLERMMVARLDAHMRDVEVSQSQFGFTPGKSTEDAWRLVSHRVAASRKKYVLSVLVDFKGAFDNLSWESILLTLETKRVKELGLWQDYFRDRWVYISNAGSTVRKEVRRGCPQGSKCGPAVWNLVINDLLLALEREHHFVVAFADDLNILIESDSRSELERLGNHSLGICSDWGNRVGVMVSIEKTECILLKGKLSLNRPPNIKLNGRSIRYVTQTKYLGLIVGERMHFRPHLEYIRAKMLGLVGCFRRILRKEWGLGKRAFRILYKGLFVACMSYGASIWFRTLRFSFARNLLNRGQRQLLYCGMNVCRTTSTDAMQVLYGELPWDLEATRRGLLTEFRKGIAPVDGDPITNVELVGLNIKEGKALIEARMFELWQRRWDESPNGRLTHEFIADVQFVGTHESFNPDLHLTYLLTGHGSMNEFLYKRGLCHTSQCMCGAPVEDAKHIIGECVLYHDVRNLNACGLRYVSGVLKVDGALETIETYQELSQFATAAFTRRRELLNME